MHRRPRFLRSLTSALCFKSDSIRSFPRAREAPLALNGRSCWTRRLRSKCRRLRTRVPSIKKRCWEIAPPSSKISIANPFPLTFSHSRRSLDEFLSADYRTATDTAAKKYFGDSGAARDANALAKYYRSRKIAFVIFAVDERLTGRAHVSNDEVVQFAEQNSDVAIPFASIDPNRGAEGVQEAKRLVSAGKIRGLKLHPPVQKFIPSDSLAYPLYEIFAEAQLPVIFHTGHSGLGTGMPGGGGVRLKYGHPMPIDDVAVDFPSMP